VSCCGEIITDETEVRPADTLYEKDVTCLVYADATSAFTINTFITGGDSLARALVIADASNT
jgi:hypothetical protein